MISPSVSPTGASPVDSLSNKNIQWAESVSPPGEATGFSSTRGFSRHTTVSFTSYETTHLDEEEEYVPTVDPSIATVDENSPWAKKYILSLDGGGVRGYSSLLILKSLMDEIASLEKQDNPSAGTSAFSPLIDLTSLYSDPMMKELQDTYRPCHYFDYIAGSSTGGLIAIMLGRLRMTVDQCLDAYKSLSAKVFEKPSSRLKRSLNKYNSSTRRDTLAELFLTLRPAQPSPNEQSGKFKSDATRCRTIVCSNRSDLKNKVTAPYVFRSYEHTTRHTLRPFLYPRNPDDPSEFDITQVARATSAAPSYFKSTRLFEYRYSDAAVNINNPSLEVYQEVSFLNKAHESIELLLSLGTGNAKGSTTKAKHALQRELNDISDLVHHRIEDVSQLWDFSYYRLDVQDGLQDVRLDEWKPVSSGDTTRERIERATCQYLEATDTRKKIRKCAATMVFARSLRAQTMRWESYATGTRYRCPMPACKDQRRRFQNRNELMDHLQMEHGKAPPDAENFQEIQTLLDQGRTNSE
ncbi:MAG: hypothetical protein Q9186_003156 [Xanthomendoza sp. 1 TL-2023]